MSGDYNKSENYAWETYSHLKLVVNLIVFLINLQNIMCQIFTVQKYRFGNIISTPREMCVHELYTIESSNMTWKMKTSTRTINNYYSN